MSGLQKLQKAWQALTKGPSFDRVLNKCLLVKAQDGTSTVEMTVSEEDTNRGGTLHGGLTATIVDIASGFGLITHEKNPAVGVSLDLHISYINPAQIGDVIVVESTTNKVGKNIAFLTIVVKNKANGKVIATASHTKFVGVK